MNSNLISNAVLKNFLQVKNTRNYMREKLGIQASTIPLDIIISVVDYQINLNKALTMKRFLAESQHSPTGIRYHLQSLIDDGLIGFEESDEDKRLRLIKAQPKLFQKIEEFNLLVFK